jgi:hypothetical protein
MKLPITITYNSGTVETYTAQPPEWAKWERETGNKITYAEGNIGIWDLMFLAYHAHKREAAGQPVKPFDVWSLTVEDIQAGESDPKAINAEA